MKKTFWSLAALMMLMSAPVMTSCSNDIDEVAPAVEAEENVVTLTIKMPEQAETRVGIDHRLKLTGWELNDEVKLYCINAVGEDVTFTDDKVTLRCTNPSDGTFTGTLPTGKTLNDYNLAVYGRDVKYDHAFSDFMFFSANDVHNNLKDCIFLAGEINAGSCTMSIYNNVIKVTNHKSPIEGAWRSEHASPFMKPYGVVYDKRSGGFTPGYLYENSTFDNAKITIPTGVSYIFMPEMHGWMSFVEEDDDENYIFNPKDFGSGVVGKFYSLTIGTPTTGTLQTYIDGANRDINWVQLWEDGPKFAEMNIGATSPSDLGTKMTWHEATEVEDSYVWGNEWCTPSKAVMEELVKAATSTGSEEVTCIYTQVDGVYGFKFTGRKSVYTSNSVFFPCPYGESSEGKVDYWTSTESILSFNAYTLYLVSNNDHLYHRWNEFDKGNKYYVRPVLKY